MNAKSFFFILFILFHASFFAQEYIKVNTKYDKKEKWNELTVELVNISDVEIGISNFRFGDSEYFSYFELYFYDKNGQEIPVSYFPSTFGIPFINAFDKPKYWFLIKPNDSANFRYSIETLFNFCKEPEKIKEMKLRFYIKYIFEHNNVAKWGVFEDFSKTIKF